MTQLVSYYEDKPLDLKGNVEITQRQMDSAVHVRTTDGAVLPNVVYVFAPPSPVTTPLLIPLGSFEAWALRDKYTEALRIMNDLGACEVRCESFRRATTHRRFRIGVKKVDVEAKLVKVDDIGFDYHHVGRGAAPQDPSPLRWPDEPGFEAARTSVLNNGAREVAITIRSSSSLSVGSDLGHTLKKLGFNLGIGQERELVNTLQITARFPEPPKRGWQ